MRAFVFVLLSALLLGGCSSDSTSTLTPTAATGTSTTDTFSGSIAQLATAGNPFVVAISGNVSITLTSVGPLSTMALGVGIATWDGTTCSTTPISKNDNARVGVAALSGTATAGNYCVTVYDSGNIPEGWTVTYAIQVVHT